MSRSRIISCFIEVYMQAICFWLHVLVKVFYCWCALFSKLNRLVCLKASLAVVMYERLLYVKRGQIFPLDHISFFFFPLRGSIEGNRMKLCLLTFQTAPAFWSVTSFTPRLDWTPCGLLNCQSHNHFHSFRRTDFYFLERGWGWGGCSFKSTLVQMLVHLFLSFRLLIGRWPSLIRRFTDLEVEGQQALWANPVRLQEGGCRMWLEALTSGFQRKGVKVALIRAR